MPDANKSNPAGVPLADLVRYADRLLHLDAFTDWEQARNGLQMENQGRVHRLAATVDATARTVQLAAAAGADLLIVHHGLFWNRPQPWTGPVYSLLRNLIDNNLAVYSAHLPLDAHPVIGNNALLCGALGWKSPQPFFHHKSQYLGLRVQTRINRQALVEKLARILGHRPHLIPGGPAQCRQIGVVTGGAGAELRQAAAEGVDTFITGEGPHWTYAVAEDLALNVLYGGHYATETFGVKALAARLSKRFGLPWTFVDYPTGL